MVIIIDNFMIILLLFWPIRTQKKVKIWRKKTHNLVKLTKPNECNQRIFRWGCSGNIEVGERLKGTLSLSQLRWSCCRARFGGYFENISWHIVSACAYKMGIIEPVIYMTFNFCLRVYYCVRFNRCPIIQIALINTINKLFFIGLCVKLTGAIRMNENCH